MTETRHCPTCWAAYRLDTPRCPRDGTELVTGTDPILGRTVGQRYQVEALLGEGGMGRVYRVRHVGLDKTFALKVIYGDLAMDSRMVARFEREARACSRLDHPCIVSTIDFAATPEGLLYLVLEYLEGASLAELLDEETALDPMRALWLFRQVLEGLIHAHARSLIHRDLKPSNLLLIKRETGEQQVKIVDFGLAHLQVREPEGPSLTRVGEVFGTPEYMAPEQVRGEEVTPQTDLYAAGIILYEMLEGRPPFRSMTTTDTLVAQVSENPPPFGSNGLANPPPERVQKLVFQLLQKELRKRATNATSVVEEVDAILAELGSPAPLAVRRGVFTPTYERPRVMTPPTLGQPARAAAELPMGASGQTMRGIGGAPANAAQVQPSESGTAPGTKDNLLKLSSPQKTPIAVIRVVDPARHAKSATVPPSTITQRGEEPRSSARSWMVLLAVTAFVGSIGVMLLAWLPEERLLRPAIQPPAVAETGPLAASNEVAPQKVEATTGAPVPAGMAPRSEPRRSGRGKARRLARTDWSKKGESVLVGSGLSRRDVASDQRLNAAFTALAEANSRGDANRAETALADLERAAAAFDYPRSALKQRIEALDRSLKKFPATTRGLDRLRARLDALMQRLPTSLGTREQRRDLWRESARIEQEASRLR